MRIYCDIQAIQSPTNPDRGIARYVAEYARAMESNHPGAVSGWILNPHLPMPPHAVDLMPAGMVRAQDDADLEPPDIWHVLSPFEDAGVGQLLDPVWPAWARTSRTRLFVTLYDVIPLIYPDRYLAHPLARQSYTTRLRLIERADRVLAISEATAVDAVRLLGIPPSRLEVVGTGVSEHFVPATDRDAVLAQLRLDLPGLRPGYVLYTGGIDFRKNIEGLLNAYARLPQPLRTAHQLVIVCSVHADVRQHLEQRARALGIMDDFVLTGYVPDDVLLRAYQAAHLFVFPSLYEGFGLPVAEALACGVPTIVGRNSSLTEVVKDPNAWFDASIADDITRALFRALTDDALRADLTRSAAGHDHRWNMVVERSLAAYTKDLERRPPQKEQRRIAFISPLPPARSALADYSLEVLRALSADASVDVFTAEDAARPEIDGVQWYTYDALRSMLRLRGEYDQKIVALGNSELFVECLRLLRRHGGTVLAHDVRFTELFAAVSRVEPRLLDEYTSTVLDDLRAGELPERYRHFAKLDAAQYYLTNDLLVAPVAESADTVFVHSATAATLARLDLPPELRHKVRVLAYASTLRPQLRTWDPDVVASFGAVDRSHRSDVVVAAFIQLALHDPSLEFAVVGECLDEQLWRELHDAVASAGLAGRITLTGPVDHETYLAWLGRAQLAVQLQIASDGEASAAVADCLGAGIPTVVSGVGAMAELGETCRQVSPSASAECLAGTIVDLLDDDVRVEALGKRGLEYARSHSFASVAERLLERPARRREAGEEERCDLAASA